MKQTFVGIDVASADFVVAYVSSDTATKKKSYSNTRMGIKSFLKSLDTSSWCIMEATGVYSINLALAIHQQGFKVSVVNPLQIKRFAQTKLKRTKTDSVDADLIAEYGQRMQPVAYDPPAEYIRHLQQKRTTLKLLIKTRCSFTNQLRGLGHIKDIDKDAAKACKAVIASLSVQITKLESEMEILVLTHCKVLFEQLQTIPGISKKTSIELIIVSGAFKNFNSAKQFSAFIGICPCINESGSSIRGYKGISRVGDSNIRSSLYMCSMMAKVSNQACKELFDRMVLAGKPKKVALVAVMNKLIKQVFGMVNSGNIYMENLNVA